MPRQKNDKGKLYKSPENSKTDQTESGKPKINPEELAQVEDTSSIIDEVFGDPSIKHGLNFFTQGELDKIKLFRREGKAYLQCLVRRRWIVAKPEEIVRQLMIVFVRDTLNYPLAHVHCEEPIAMGTDTKKADIVVFTDDTCTQKYLIIEVKKPDRTNGMDQLKSYLSATGAFFGMWSNGRDHSYLLREENPKTKGEPYAYRPLTRLPKFGEVLDDVLQPLTLADLQPMVDLKGTILQLQEEILAHASVNAFDELFKVFFAKLYDEFRPNRRPSSPVEFRVPKAPAQQIFDRINGLFQQANDRKDWKGIFDEKDRIRLEPEVLELVAAYLEPYSLSGTDLEVVDAAFEYLINPEQKQDKGQYFTPRQVVKMAVKMLNPKPDESVIDPACGSCGFLIHTINWIRDHFDDCKTKDAIYRYANEHLFAIDNDDRLRKVAKVMMLIAGDGKANVFNVDALDFRQWERNTAVVQRIGHFRREIVDSDFDIVLTNPPFAGKVKYNKDALSVYELYNLAQSGALSVDEEDSENGGTENGRNSTPRKAKARIKRDILYIERCIRLLKPGGRMAIVLPQGNLNNIGTRSLREWIMSKCRILAVVGLEVNTFKPFTGTKTSVLFLQKWGGEAGPAINDYPVFMAVSERSGKNNSGEYVPRTDVTGHLVDRQNNPLDPARDKPVWNDDLDDIAERFAVWGKKNKFSFYTED